MIKRIFAPGGATFVLVFAWKVALLVLTAQPIPANDSFVYDGASVNYVLHGKYVNPSLALAMPISGTEIFCAYPPLHMLATIGWMSVCGVSAMSQMTMHVMLFGIYMALLYFILRQLHAPPLAINLAGAFLLVITFHDRPDSLAHVFGIGAVLAWVRSMPDAASVYKSNKQGIGWCWLMVLLAILSLCTSLQIGAVYCLVVCLGVLGGKLFDGRAIPALPMVALGCIPPALIALVVLRYPHLWAGFLEHARQTPTLTGLRRPHAVELAKLVRTLPGLLAVALALPALMRRREEAFRNGLGNLWLATVTCLVGALPIAVAAMFVLSANSVFHASYLQPLVVAGWLGLVAGLGWGAAKIRTQALAFAALAAFGAIRAIGMTTWGVACAADAPYGAVIERVRAEMQGCPSGSAAVLSSAYLYEAARSDAVRWIHSDWMAPALKNQPHLDRDALLALKPAKMVLTQFDYYRRFKPMLEELKSSHEPVELVIVDTAKVRPPDSMRLIQQMVQHVSWAPVIITFSWK